MTGVFLAVTLSLSAPHGVAEEDEAKKNGWYSDYGQALAEARKRGRLLFVVFR